MTHILVTNDDGILAPWIIQLAKSLTQLGKVTVLASDKNWSVSGHKKTLHKPLRVRRVDLINGVDTFSSDGTPSDCVAIALLGFIEEKIDLVVSGINPHAKIWNTSPILVLLLLPSKLPFLGYLQLHFHWILLKIILAIWTIQLLVKSP